jgi:hypothetical protein
MLRAALRRFFLLVALSVGLTAGGSLLTGALLGAGLERSLTLGFYLMGCFLMISGFFVGNRGPARLKSESAGSSMMPLPWFGVRQLRWATPDEQEETINNSAVFIVLGVLLLLLGVLLDTRHSLV